MLNKYNENNINIKQKSDENFFNNNLKTINIIKNKDYSIDEIEKKLDNNYSISYYNDENKNFFNVKNIINNQNYNNLNIINRNNKNKINKDYYKYLYNDKINSNENMKYIEKKRKN